MRIRRGWVIAAVLLSGCVESGDDAESSQDELGAIADMGTERDAAMDTQPDGEGDSSGRALDSGPSEPPAPSDTTASCTEGPEGPEGPPRPPSDILNVAHGHPLTDPVGGECPAGTRPSEWFTCTDVAVCHCEYICEPECAAGKICKPLDESDEPPVECQCHPALEAADDECVWSSFTDSGDFSTVDGWTLGTQGDCNAASADIEGGVLRLEVNKRCSNAWGVTTARIPPESEFPNGVALLFDYIAVGDADDRQASVSFSQERLADGPALELDGEPHEMRRCMELNELPWLAAFGFSVQANGLCAEMVDYSLEIDNLRLEPDPNCP